MPNRCLNLLAKHALRATLADEPKELGPEVACVRCPFLFAGRRERLAGGATGPDGAVGGPPGELQGVLPPSDAAKEMASPVAVAVSHNIGCLNVMNTSLVYGSAGEQISEPGGGEGVVFVEIHP